METWVLMVPFSGTSALLDDRLCSVLGRRLLKLLNVTWDPNDIWDDRHKCEIRAAKKTKAQILEEMEHLIKKA